MLNLYVVYDKVAQEGGPVYTAKNDAVAQRMFQGLINDTGINPVDYQLLHVAAYDNGALSATLPVVIPEVYEVIVEVNIETV